MTAFETAPISAGCARTAGVGAGAVLVGERTGQLVATPEDCARFAAYLDRLTTDGYDRDPAMAAYIARSRALIAVTAHGSDTDHTEA